MLSDTNKRMNRKQYEEFKETNLKERFYWVYGHKLLEHLLNKGYRYLFKAINEESKRSFWIFDKTDELVKEINDYKKEIKEQRKEKDTVLKLETETEGEA